MVWKQMVDTPRGTSEVFSTLIMCGKHDVQCPLAYSAEMNEGIPRSKLVVFNHSNHYPFLEESDTFKKEFKNFIDEIS
ncbi:pimeloyl-ACP methyl ester carboxylesterase [Neobacillus niacini]|uniref:alpha/beta fold hydrolase n=1 Tax=Neobacillus driksii TaxID=3035913 RepID=UPI00278AF0A6|nr:pimeloyl-ACP methyl ester carboxylesterase [Neobacillus niacini]